MTTDSKNTQWAQRCRALVGWLFRASATLRHSHGETPATPTPAGGTEKPLIVLVHGYEGSVSEFRALIACLQPALGDRFDFALVDTLDPSMGLAPEENAARIDEYLTAHSLQSRDLYFICHSLGGLIARCYSHRGNAASRVRALTMIATPNGGINWWNILPIHWMRSAGFTERFNAIYPALSAIRYQLLVGTKGANLVEGAPNDGVVGRWSVEAFLGCGDHCTAVMTRCYPLDHWALLRDPQVAADIAAFFPYVQENIPQETPTSR